MGHMPKMSGLKLLAAFYGELVDVVPEGAMTTAEILGAAKALIECSDNDYVDVEHKGARTSPGYFSYDLCVAFDKYQGRILANEAGVESDDLSHLELNRIQVSVSDTW